MVLRYSIFANNLLHEARRREQMSVDFVTHLSRFEVYLNICKHD